MGELSDMVAVAIIHRKHWLLTTFFLGTTGFAAVSHAQGKNDGRTKSRHAASSTCPAVRHGNAGRRVHAGSFNPGNTAGQIRPFRWWRHDAPGKGAAQYPDRNPAVHGYAQPGRNGAGYGQEPTRPERIAPGYIGHDRCPSICAWHTGCSLIWCPILPMVAGEVHRPTAQPGPD